MGKRDDEFMKKLLATFRIEAEEHLKTIGTGLLELEKDSTQEDARGGILETIYREAHSLKGASRSVNMNEIEVICQAIEGLFSLIKRDRLQITTELFDTLHRALDTINGILAGSRGVEVAAVVEQLRVLEAAGTAGEGKPSKRVRAGKADQAAEVLQGTNTVPPVLESVPSVDASPAPESLVSTDSGPPPKDKTLDAAVEEVTVTTPSGQEQPSDEPWKNSKRERHMRQTQAETVRISVDKLDPLLRQVEEMVSVKLTARQRADDLADAVGLVNQWRKKWNAVSSNGSNLNGLLSGKRKISESGKTDTRLTKLGEFLEWNQSWVKTLENKLTALSQSAKVDERLQGGMVDDLLEDMMNVLMLPCASVLDIFPKLVRDLARDSGKEVNLNIVGADLEIDRRIIDEMKDPLIHLVRNCIDHGIEDPQERTAAKKPRQGTITVAFSQISGNQIGLLVSDDGAGIDVEKVRDAATLRGIISDQEKARLEDQDALSLVFRSDVSTSAIVTNISGRGLGLAIVREKVENLGGTISVETTPRVGTSFRIILPVTMSTFRGILVSSSDQWFVIPTASVERVTRIRTDIIETVGNKETIEFNGRAIPLVSLAEILELPKISKKSEDAKFIPALMLRSGETTVAFEVGAILQEQEVLVKGLGKQLTRVRNVAGATVLGSGKLVPILNVPDLIKSVTKGSYARTGTATRVEESKNGHKSVLVVEDSITSRMLLKNILETAGYQVSTSVDGADAWSVLKQEEFDIVVSDVEMPRLNGFELTSKIRGDEKLTEMPVVLVTSLGSREDRERGIDVGANAYIVKEGFDQNNLLQTISRLV